MIAARRGLPLLWALFLAAPARAEVRAGVFGGPNLARIAFKDLPPEVRVSDRTTFGAGVVLTWVANETASIELQPMWLGKGATLGAGGLEIQARFSYIEVPLVAKAAFGRGAARPYVLGGVSLGFRNSAKLRVRFAGQEQEEDAKDDIKGTDWGLAFGGGLRTAAGRVWVFVEGQYILGLTNIDTTGDATLVEPRNRGLQMRVGVSVGAER